MANKLAIRDTTEPLRLEYDADSYVSFTVNSAGHLGALPVKGVTLPVEHDLIKFEPYAGNAPWRIFTGHASADTLDQVLYHTYNLTPGSTTPDVTARPGIRFGYEAEWAGTFEWNLDVKEPGDTWLGTLPRLYMMTYNWGTAGAECSFDFYGVGAFKSSWTSQPTLAARGASGQTAELQVWQSNAAATLASVDKDGRIYTSTTMGIGTTPSAARAVQIAGTLSGSVSQFGIVSEPVFSSQATTSGYGIYVRPITQAAAFTQTSTYGIFLAAPTLGAGSTISNAFGLYIQDIAAGTKNWAIYTLGSARSFFNGGIGLGNSTASTTAGALARKSEVFDSTGASLGFIYIYSS